MGDGRRADDHAGRGGPAAGRCGWTPGTTLTTMDPALAYAGPSWQLLYATCAKLLNYPDKAGPAGLAADARGGAVAADRLGRRQDLHVHDPGGFRFSPPSNQPVTAQTFKDTIERTLNPRMRARGAGVRRHRRRPRVHGRQGRHISGVVARRRHADDPSASPRRRLPLADRAAGVLRGPVQHPDRPQRGPTIPSAGPVLRLVLHARPGLVLARNPNYHGSRPHHFARIELAVGSLRHSGRSPTSRPAPPTTHARSDSDLLDHAADARLRLAARYGPGSAAAARGQPAVLRQPAARSSTSSILNTHRPLFSDVRLRQAVNYAINRRALAGSGRLPTRCPSRPTDHYLPPGMPGYRDAHVYPLTPDLGKGASSSPAHAAAEPPCSTPATLSAMRASRRRSSRPTSRDRPSTCRSRAFPVRKMFAREANSREHRSISPGTAGHPTTPIPPAMLNSILKDSSVCARRSRSDLPAPARRRRPADRPRALPGIRQARRRSRPQRRAAASRSATLPSNDFFSARIGCQTYGVYGIDLAALCVRHPEH